MRVRARWERFVFEAGEEALRWEPTRRGLIADLEGGHYFV